MNISYYQILVDDETVAKTGDIVRVDWDRDSDGTPAFNMTQGHTYCPFRTSNGKGELIAKKISKESAMAAMEDPYVKLIKKIMRDEDTNLLQAAGIAMRAIGDATDKIREEFETFGRVQA